MKTAVLVTGHPRSYSKTFQALMSNVIEPNQSDVFLSVWDRNEDGSVVDLDALQNTYKPKKIVCSSNEEYENKRQKFTMMSRNGDCFTTNIRAYLSLKTSGTRHIDRIQSQWFIVKMGMQELSTADSYDVVMRVRFDVQFRSKVNLCKVDLKSRACYVPTLLESVKRDHYLNCGLSTPIMTDHWCYGRYDSMMTYGILYDHLMPMYEMENIPISNAEEMFAYFMLTRLGGQHYIDCVPYDLIR